MGIQLPTFLTSALNRGKLLATRLGHLNFGKFSLITIEQQAGWATEPVWQFWWTDKYLSSARNRSIHGSPRR